MRRTSLRVASVAVALLALAAAIPASAADPIAWRKDYAAARKEAAEKKLPILVVIGSGNCVYCRKMEATTFADPGVQALVAGKFIPLKVDADAEPEFVRAMKVGVYPTSVIAGPDGKVYAFLAGYLNADAFRDNADKALALLPNADKPTDAVVASKAAPTGALAARPVAAEPLAVGKAADWLAAAKESQRAGRFGDCLERCEAVAAAFPRTPEAGEALTLVSAIKADADKLSAATEQLDEKFAATYAAMADAWVQKGKVTEAAACLDKAVRLSGGKQAEAYQARLAALKLDRPTVTIQK